MIQDDRKKVAKLNQLLASELGVPPYQWKWSEDLEISMRVIHDDGTLKFDYQANPQTGLIEALPVYERRKVLMKNRDQWVLCRLLSEMSEGTWRRTFGSLMEWPGVGMWTPCTGPLGPVAIDPGKIPSMEDTWACIRLIREDRAMTRADQRKSVEQALQKKEDDAYRFWYETTRDAAPAFGGIPGKKTHWSPTGHEEKQAE